MHSFIKWYYVFLCFIYLGVFLWLAKFRRELVSRFIHSLLIQFSVNSNCNWVLSDFNSQSTNSRSTIVLLLFVYCAPTYTKDSNVSLGYSSGCLARSRRRPIEQITEDFGSSAWWAFSAGTFNCSRICICSYSCICSCICIAVSTSRSFGG